MALEYVEGLAERGTEAESYPAAKDRCSLGFEESGRRITGGTRGRSSYHAF